MSLADIDIVGRRVRVLVGDSVREDALLTMANGVLHIEFEADNLDNIAVDLGKAVGER